MSRKLADNRILYGFYSYKAIEQGCSRFLYTEPRYNRELVVTCVTEDPAGRDYLWDDKVFLGPVEEFIKRFDRIILSF